MGFQWLSAYGPWGLVIFLLLAGASTGIGLVLKGTIVPSSTLAREAQERRDLLAPMEKAADSLENNTDAVIGLQAAVRDLQEGQRTLLHALEAFQQQGKEAGQ